MHNNIGIKPLPSVFRLSSTGRIGIECIADYDVRHRAADMNCRQLMQRHGIEVLDLLTLQHGNPQPGIGAGKMFLEGSRPQGGANLYISGGFLNCCLYKSFGAFMLSTIFEWGMNANAVMVGSAIRSGQSGPHDMSKFTDFLKQIPYNTAFYHNGLCKEHNSPMGSTGWTQGVLTYFDTETDLCSALQNGSTAAYTEEYSPFPVHTFNSEQDPRWNSQVLSRVLDISRDYRLDVLVTLNMINLLSKKGLDLLTNDDAALRSLIGRVLLTSQRPAQLLNERGPDYGTAAVLGHMTEMLDEYALANQLTEPFLMSDFLRWFNENNALRLRQHILQKQ